MKNPLRRVFLGRNFYFTEIVVLDVDTDHEI